MSKNFNWYNFLELAEMLLNKDLPNEAELRTAISRTYYAAYHLVREGKPQIARTSDLSKTSRHLAFWNELSNGEEKDYKFSLIGDSLKKKRIIADYKIRFYGNIKKKAKESLINAKKLINAYPSKL